MLETKMLNSLRGLGEDFLHELISIYLRDVPGMVTQIELSIKTRDDKTGSMAAHSLKGTSYSLGVKALGDLCNEFENAFDDQKFDGLEEKFIQLQEELTCSIDELKHVQKQLMRSMQMQAEIK
jgi:histidine phosphotransfer protein HptB